MLKHRSILATILTLCLIISLFTLGACTRGNTDDSSDNATSEAVPDPNSTEIAESAGQHTDTATGDAALMSAAVPQSALLSAEEVQALREDNACRVIDTRSFADFTLGSIPQAVSIPLRFLTKRYHEVPMDMTIVMTSTSEKEMSLVYGTLLSLGFDANKLFFLEGGFEAWVAAGYHIQTHYGSGC